MGCYNLRCPGFIQTSDTIVIGGSISPVSVFEGDQYEITVSVWKDQKSGNWWLSLGSNYSLVGYWPAPIFVNLAYADDVQWGGEIVNSNISGRHTTTQMGSGHFPDEGFGRVGYVRNLEIVDNNNEFQPVHIKVIATDPKFYTIKNMTGDDWGTYLFYGGSGFSQIHSGAGNAEYADVSECRAESGDPSCHNNKIAQKLKLIAIPSILVANMIGVSLPLLSRSIPALGRPDRDMFVIVKTLASSVILTTGFMHVLPDSFDDLTSKCLPEAPWRKFPFSTFISTVSALLALMIDSYAMRTSKREGEAVPLENGSNSVHTQEKVNDDKTSQLLRNRVIALVSELGIVVHSFVTGLAMGASDNKCTIRSLIAALCFHQLVEGMRLGGSILQAELKSNMNWIMVFFFPVTTQVGIALGMEIQKIYDETSPTSLIVVGILNACSAGLLIYMALVNLLAHEFFGRPNIQGNMKLHFLGYVAVFIGAGGMSLMAKWA
ncbi:unnamed protein product [Arabidopsis arenosa]|uniref:Neprosin PEP catalytic domain-containing protein n=1 Tax=Arabidopsis arenosa TaxID=38785 RepID=A0A8S2AB78_ARAAE|nr:unnamed protein product [Arabidopsis arenosa]